MQTQSNIIRAVELLYRYLNSVEELARLTRQDIQRTASGYVVFGVPVRSAAVNRALTYILGRWCASGPKAPVLPWWPKATEAMSVEHIMLLLSLSCYRIPNDITLAQLLLFHDWCAHHAAPDRKHDVTAVADMIASAEPATGSLAWKSWVSFLQHLRSTPSEQAQKQEPSRPPVNTPKPAQVKQPHAPKKAIPKAKRPAVVKERQQKRPPNEQRQDEVRPVTKKAPEKAESGLGVMQVASAHAIGAVSPPLALTEQEILSRSSRSPVEAVWAEHGKRQTVPASIYAVLGPDAGNYLGAEHLEVDGIFQVVLGRNVMTGRRMQPYLDDGWYVRCCYTTDKKPHRLIRLIAPYQVQAAEYLRRCARGHMLFNPDLSGPILTWGLRSSQYPIIGRLEGEPNGPKQSS